MPTHYVVGRHEIRVAERQLLADGRPAALGSRAFDLLLALVERAGRVVPKDELIEVVWPGLVVEENNLQVQVSALRKLLGAQAIATVPGRGYRLALPVDAADGAPSASTPAATGAPARATPGNLPPHAPVLVGRDEALHELVAQIEAQPLVTLVGAAGMGKTTLARAAAQALRERWPGGAWWVELAPVVDPAQVPLAVAQALQVTLGGSAPASELLAGVLQPRAMLLVLDNCEHVVDAAAALAATLLEQAPGVHLLATSQELLNVAGERVVRLDPLAMPAGDVPADEAARFGAIRLFAERARAVDPRFELGPGNVDAVTDICRHLDGLPLAIELAAARVRLLGVQGVREHLGERFRVLTGGARTVMRRHQTLRAAIEWSHALLSPTEQAVLRRLGIFAGGFTLVLAQQVAAGDAVEPTIDEWAVLDALAALVDKSMVVAQGDDTPRYTMLESTRAFALEKLADAGETVAVAQRHALAVLALFTHADEGRFGEHGDLDEIGFLDIVRPEIDNLRAAADWAAASDDPTLALDLAAASSGALDYLGLGAEAMARLRPLLPRLVQGSDPAREARALCAASLVGRDRWGDDAEFAAWQARAAAACRALGWHRRLHGVLHDQGWHHMRRGENDAATRLVGEMERLELPQWPPWRRRHRLNLRATVLTNSGSYVEARRLNAEIDALLPPGEERGRFILRLNAGITHSFEQQWALAVAALAPLVDELERRGARGGDRWTGGWAHAHLALALTELGRLDEAQARLAAAVPLWRADGIVNMGVHIAARLFAAQGRFADAMRLVGYEQALPVVFAASEPLAARTREATRRAIEAAVPDPDTRERWCREGAALDEAAVAASCQRPAAVAAG